MNRAYLIVFRTLSGGDYFVVAFEERVWDELARTKELGNSLLAIGRCQLAGDGVDVAAGRARAGLAGVRGEGPKVGVLVAEIDNDPVADMQARAGGDHPRTAAQPGVADRRSVDPRRTSVALWRQHQRC